MESRKKESQFNKSTCWLTCCQEKNSRWETHSFVSFCNLNTLSSFMWFLFGLCGCRDLSQKHESDFPDSLHGYYPVQGPADMEKWPVQSWLSPKTSPTSDTVTGDMYLFGLQLLPQICDMAYCCLHGQAVLRFNAVLIVYTKLFII